MNPMPILRTILLVCVGLFTAGCARGPLMGEGDGGSSSTPTGTVSDGHVLGATVYLDYYDNHKCLNSGGTGLISGLINGLPVTTTTDSSGNFTFDPALGQHIICVIGGTDTATGLPQIGELFAPPLSASDLALGAHLIISPLSALVMADINVTQPTGAVSPSLSDSTAANVSASLGLGGTNVLTVDPALVVNGTPVNALLQQATSSVKTLLTQTASVVQSAANGTGTPASASNPVSSALFNDSLSSLASALTSNTVTPSTIGNLAQSVISSTVTAAQSDPVVTTALPGVSALNAGSVANVAASSLESLVNTVGSTSAASLLTTIDNPAAAAQTSSTISNLVGSVANLLTTAGATTASVLGNDFTSLTGITANNGAVTSTLDLLSSPVTTLPLGNSPLQNLAINLAPIATGGIATTGTSSSSTTGTTPVTGSEVDSTITVNVLPASTGLTSLLTNLLSPQSMTMTLDHVLLYQVPGTGNSTIGGTIPSTATLLVNSVNGLGTTVFSVPLSGTAAAGILTFDPSTGTLEVNLAALQTALGTNASQFSALSALEGSGNSPYLITLTIPGLILSNGASTPALGNSFTIEVNL